MFFWIIYFLCSLCLAYLFSNFFTRNHRFFLFTTFCTLLLTPSLIELNSGVLAPSIFIFFFDLLFQQSFSLRSLKPLVFTLPGILLLLFICNFFRKKLF